VFLFRFSYRPTSPGGRPASRFFQGDSQPWLQPRPRRARPHRRLPLACHPAEPRPCRRQSQERRQGRPHRGRRGRAGLRASRPGDGITDRTRRPRRSWRFAPRASFGRGVAGTRLCDVLAGGHADARRSSRHRPGWSHPCARPTASVSTDLLTEPKGRTNPRESALVTEPPEPLVDLPGYLACQTALARGRRLALASVPPTSHLAFLSGSAALLCRWITPARRSPPGPRHRPARARARGRTIRTHRRPGCRPRC
jgi:hypothetical protein